MNTIELLKELEKLPIFQSRNSKSLLLKCNKYNLTINFMRCFYNYYNKFIKFGYTIRPTTIYREPKDE